MEVSDGLAKVRIHLLQLSAGLLEIRAVHTILLLAAALRFQNDVGSDQGASWCVGELASLEINGTELGNLEDGVRLHAKLRVRRARKRCRDPRVQRVAAPGCEASNRPYIGATLFAMASIMLVQKP